MDTGTEFWIAAVGMTLLVAGLLLVALRRGGEATPTAAYDLQVYRDQLREVERDRARGLIAAEEAERLRAEVARRVLAADQALSDGAGETAGPAAASGTRAPRAAQWVAGGLILLLGLGSLYLYTRIGAPDYPDMPLAERLAEARKIRADRPSQATMEAQQPAFTPPAKLDPRFAALIDQLRKAVAAHPDDLRGQKLLARSAAEIGDYRTAWRAQAAVVRLLGPKATAADEAAQAGMMILATDGRVSPEADAPLNAALRLDPQNGTALYYTGLMFGQTGRPDLAFNLWAPLLERSTASDPWVGPIRAQIGTAAQLAGVAYQLPPLPASDTATGNTADDTAGPEDTADAPAPPGPDADQVAAARKMAPGDRKQMILGMVEGLAARLDKQGGSAADWARLIHAYGVLGEDAKRDAALARAQAAYPDDATARASFVEAAQAQNLAATADPAPPAGDATTQGTDGSGESRAQIAGMVDRLDRQLHTSGGTPAQWAQLISAYAVLGQSDRARKLWTEAQQVFSGASAELAPVRAAAQKAGVTE